ncbi:gamma carbonic anhydrase family protein [Fictibacillus sp. WQ 8-8]|uniref:Gamma carbonic anhydrase family protein n=1 Tax=Fictibacillus marinisediminis TaxID=2878389 RepID=A0A9X1X8J7_9BACL|nr:MULTISPECIES: gamma carbonic anhydrase family protein [Fictibacillus]MCK6255919.1 gamma carbonic anhydrase family protein [Fictibacillus marinisediminis]MCQ6266991.1 gamma carbonic anhydrase family protein [Fictibacillus sp. WQ 8-8]MED2974024.1 gamma carbonic anhydrase family protein [Fictibacillus sp. B-59209]SFE20583.1 Carbonic anhydrase or acetyltransferase, isoleucine patch superfamily [Bacillus sp. OV194]
MNYTFNGKEPQIDESAFIAPGVHIIGDVKIGKESSIWFNSVLRGDEGPITIGDRCNVQDNCTLHLYEQYPLVLEDEVSIGHNVILHGCTVRKGALIGMGATILDGAEIGEQAFIGANTLIPPGKKIPPRTMVMGSPGQVIRELNDKDLEIIRITIETYQQKGQQFKQELK